MSRARQSSRPFLVIGLLTALWLTLSGCGRPGTQRAADARSAAAPRPTMALDYFRPEPIGAPIGRPPWIGHVNTVDLDRDGLLDVLFCESQENQVLWLRQSSRGVFEEKLLASNMSAPVHVEAADMDGDGDLDVIVSSMGVVFPDNDRIGTVFILENDGRENFTPHAVIEHTSRVVDARAADMNGDGQIDLVLGQFGYDQGEISWLERTGPWEFRRHVLLDLSGAINVCVEDYNADGHLDIAALISQQWEEIYLFAGDGRGGFTTKRIWGSTNEDYGSSGMTSADLNRDGRPDLIYTNGDGFGPAATPGPRPWHGVQWFENKGDGNFRFHRIAAYQGAYSPVAADLDGDGAIDIVASSAYADWNNSNRSVVSLVWFRNDGRMNFEPRVLAKTPKDLITLAAGDFDGTGQMSLVTGGFYIYPPYDSMGRIMLWRRQATPAP